MEYEDQVSAFHSAICIQYNRFRMAMWDHFERLKKDGNESCRAKCNHCASEFSYNQKTTSSMGTNLKVSIGS